MGRRPACTRSNPLPPLPPHRLPLSVATCVCLLYMHHMQTSQGPAVGALWAAAAKRGPTQIKQWAIVLARLALCTIVLSRVLRACLGCQEARRLDEHPPSFAGSACGLLGAARSAPGDLYRVPGAQCASPDLAGPGSRCPAPWPAALASARQGYPGAPCCRGRCTTGCWRRQRRLRCRGGRRRHLGPHHRSGAPQLPLKLPSIGPLHCFPPPIGPACAARRRHVRTGSFHPACSACRARRLPPTAAAACSPLARHRRRRW